MAWMQNSGENSIPKFDLGSILRAPIGKAGGINQMGSVHCEL